MVPSSYYIATTNDQKLRIGRTIGYYAAFIALGLISASLGPTLPSLADHTQTRLSEISFLFTARGLGYLLGSLQGGRLYDRKTGHPLMAGMLLGAASSLALAPVIPHLWLLTGLMLLLGFTEGAVDVGGNALLVWVHRDRVGPFMNGLHFFFGVGAFLSPLIVAQAILASGDIYWAYWILAALLIPVVAYLLRIPSPAIQHAAENGGREKKPLRLVALIVAFFFLYVGAEVSFGGWIFTYATRSGMSDLTSAAYLTSAFWGSLTVGRLLSIPLAARLRPRTILLSDLVGCLFSVSVILLWPGSPAAIWVGTLGIGLCMASIFPTTLTFAGRHMTITGKVTSWFFVGASLGGMTLPWLIGQLFERFGPQSTMFTILLDLIVALGIFTALMATSSRRDTRQA
jgi:FHS family Na+ dependent glucose MFS transporter 1